MSLDDGALDNNDGANGDGGAGEVDQNLDKGTPPDGSSGDPVNIYADLEEGDREWAEKWHKGDLGKLVKAARESDRLVSGSVQVPAADADQEAWDKFYTKLGRPAEATGYEFAVPETLPENMPYDGEAADWLKGVSHELGLSSKQASALHDKYVELQVGRANGMNDEMAGALQTRIDTSIGKLTDKWGPRDGGTFKANVELGDRFFKAVDADGTLKGELEAAGLMGPNGEVLSSSLAFAFSNAGAALYSEGGAFDAGDGGNLQGNPFENDNLTAIMQVVKADPEKARDLARAAGKPLAQYGL